MSNLLTQHNRNSFNNFIDIELFDIVKEIRNPLRILKNKSGTEYKTEVYLLDP